MRVTSGKNEESCVATGLGVDSPENIQAMADEPTSAGYQKMVGGPARNSGRRAAKTAPSFHVPVPKRLSSYQMRQVKEVTDGAGSRLSHQELQ